MDAMTDTISILERLVSFPTVSADSNLALIDFVETYLTDRGFAVHRTPNAEGTKAGLFARLAPKDEEAEGAGVLLSAHSDVVPVVGQDWHVDPFKLTVDGDRLYGRGTTDMKGFLAAMLSLADRASRVDLKAPLSLSVSYDEEVGCVGIRQMIDDMEPGIGLPDLCIIGEPTEMQPTIGHKGKLSLKATCIGQSGHSALAPQFVNALHLASEFVIGLSTLQETIAQSGVKDEAYSVPYSTIHVGTLSGGTALNIVPDRAAIEFEIRHLAADDPDALLARVVAVAREIEDRYRPRFDGAEICIERVGGYPGLDMPAAHAAVDRVRALSGMNSTGKVAFGTEAGFFAERGIPTVVCGPGSMEGQGHKPDEYVTRDQLAACDRMLDRLLDQLT